MLRWASNDYMALKNLLRIDGQWWRSFEELRKLKNSPATPTFYTHVLQSTPWEARPLPPPSIGQWLAHPDHDGSIQRIFHLQQSQPSEATVYQMEPSKQIQPLGQTQPLLEGHWEIRIVRCGGPKRFIIVFNPQEDLEEEQILWL